METIGRAALPNPSRLIHNWFALLCVCVLPVSAQSPSTSVTPSASTSSSLPAGAHAVITLDGAWRFHTGDDPQWANPEFNDSDWPTVTVGESLTTQGIDTYSGFAWYRMRLQPQVVSQLGGMPGIAHAIFKTGFSRASSAGQSSSRTLGQRRRPIKFALGEHGPGYPGQLIGQRHADDVVVCSRCELRQPCPQTGRLLLSELQNCTSTLYKQFSQVRVAAFADAEQFLLAAGGVFAWNQADPGSELPAFAESRTVSDSGDQCRCCKWPDAGDRVQTLTSFTLVCGLLNQRLHFL